MRCGLHFAATAATIIVLSGCASGGEQSSSRAEPADTYPVTIQARTLEFGSISQAQTINGVQINLGVRDNVPALYYRYDVTSRVNGNYFMMPNPPKLYTVYRIPFYRNTPPNAVLKLTLTNNSAQVIETSSAICAFDVDGKTIQSLPIHLPDLLPGHVLVTQVNGPTLDQLQGHRTLTVWIYHLGDPTAVQPYKWVLPFQLTEQARSADAEFVGQSPREADVARFRGRIDPGSGATDGNSP